MPERLKDDHGKPRFDLIDPDFELGLATVLAHGAEKYKANSWKGIELDAYRAALKRHLNALDRGEYFDPDSGLPHTDHIAANAMFIHYLAREEYNNDDTNIQRDADTSLIINPVSSSASEDRMRHHDEAKEYME